MLSFLSETLVNNQCGASFEETKNFCNKKYYTVIKKDSLQKCSYEYDKKECGEEKKGNWENLGGRWDLNCALKEMGGLTFQAEVEDVRQAGAGQGRTGKAIFRR